MAHLFWYMLTLETTSQFILSGLSCPNCLLHIFSYVHISLSSYYDHLHHSSPCQSLYRETRLFDIPFPPWIACMYLLDSRRGHWTFWISLVTSFLFPPYSFSLIKCLVSCSIPVPVAVECTCLYASVSLCNAFRIISRLCIWQQYNNNSILQGVSIRRKPPGRWAAAVSRVGPLICWTTCLFSFHYFHTFRCFNNFLHFCPFCNCHTFLLRHRYGAHLLTPQNTDRHSSCNFVKWTQFHVLRHHEGGSTTHATYEDCIWALALMRGFAPAPPNIRGGSTPRRFLTRDAFVIAMMFNLLSVCPPVCLSWTGVNCDHTVQVGADLSLWLDSPMFWAPWHQGMYT